jgi:hypothetical protein
MSGIAIRIDKETYNEIKPIAKASFRSIPNQLAYYAKIGRAVIENPDLPVDFVNGIFEALKEKSAPFEFKK